LVLHRYHRTTSALIFPDSYHIDPRVFETIVSLYEYWANDIRHRLSLPVVWTCATHCTTACGQADQWHDTASCTGFQCDSASATRSSRLFIGVCLATSQATWLMTAHSSPTPASDDCILLTLEHWSSVAHKVLLATEHSLRPLRNYIYDPNYTAPSSKQSAVCATSENEYVTEYQVFEALDKLRPSATGLDNMPTWFLRLGAPIFAKPVAQLFNCSIRHSVVPQQWKRARIRPIPKTCMPNQHADFRPISVTPVLTRVTERTVVKTFLYPAILSPPVELNFADQYAFRPTGSTEAAIIHLLQTITNMLLTNPYVTVISSDFSKAFDTVRHSTLLEKISFLDIPDHVYNWIVDFFREYSHCTAYRGQVSTEKTITASIVEGSGVGPASYVIYLFFFAPPVLNSRGLKN